MARSWGGRRPGNRCECARSWSGTSKGDALWGETIFFDNAALLKQIDAQIEIPPPTGAMKPAAFTLDDTALLGHGIRINSGSGYLRLVLVRRAFVRHTRKHATCTPYNEHGRIAP